MRSVILSASIVLFASVHAQQQLGNGNLEAWEMVPAAGGGTTEEPQNWNSFKTGSGGLATLFGSTTIAKSTSIRTGATGQYCARIWSKSTLGIIANGNMTLGRINMGSSTATDPDNYNYTIMADPAFSEPLTDVPDSLVFWVKYTAAAGQEERVSAVLHGDYDYRDGYVPHAGSAPYKVAEISHNYPPTNGQWVRKSVPWDYTGPASTHTYVLITFSTNKTPGGGAANDEVLIDDIELIYNPDPDINLPIAVYDDNVLTDFNTPVIIDVLTNDEDPENDIDESSLTILSTPLGGTAIINTTDYTITYTPNTGFWGDDQFNYSVCDNGNPAPVTCDQATVFITVNEELSVAENGLSSLTLLHSGGNFKLQSDDQGEGTVSIYSANGALVKSAKMNEYFSFGAETGIYFFHVITEKGSRTIKYFLN
jgi:hypothetical protein